MLTPFDKIYLANSKIAGRGVFAKVSIKKGETIEIAPVIVIPSDQQKDINPDLGRYIFKWPVFGRDTIAIAMGFGSFYNHSASPNAEYAHSLFNRTIVFIALKEIQKDEEITHNYGYKIRPVDIKK